MESMSVVTFWWPSNEDIPAYLEDGVLCQTEPPIPINQRGRHKLSEADLLANEMITSRK